MGQQPQVEWYQQWAMLSDHEEFLFRDWIHPATLESLRDKDVLEGGCGGGQHTALMAPFARGVTAVDLNTVDLARRRAGGAANVEFVAADLATMDLGRRFDVVLSVGVVHHTDDPDRSVANLRRHLKPGGRLILWVYSLEGNLLMRALVEPARKLLLRRLPRTAVLGIARALTALLVPVVYSIYLLPLPFLPYYRYFRNFRRLSFARNVLNVFDKLNAPQVHFVDRAQAAAWFPHELFRDVHLDSYCGVSWRASGTLREAR